MEDQYLITESVAMLSDSPQHIDYHIRTGDYFAVLATALGFMEEALDTCAEGDASHAHKQLARELRQDLRYVQANYTIAPRPLGDVQTIRPSGNLLGA